ncbi:MAG: hypothetical protein U0359_06540 [Byssovorax sp.]
MRRRPVPALVLLALAAAAAGAAYAGGCAATTDTNTFTTSSTTGTGGSGSGNGGSSNTTATSGTGGHGGNGEGGIVISGSGGGTGGEGGVIVNPCGSKCGPKELCDPEHLGLDDNCDGQVDEGCPCSAGQAHACFKGDPSYHNAPGCFDGTEKCSEFGSYGPCVGGVHATPPDNCFLNDMSACHAIHAPPFADVNLKDGTGNFSANAVPGSETWTVTCPDGVNCPAVGGINPPDDFKPLQSGEYSVLYSKMVAGNNTPQTCVYPLFVGAPGLRVELQWEHTPDDSGVDLDLHVHQPNNSQPWGISPGKPQDCTWSNCVIDDFSPPQNFESPKWFADPPAQPPDPVNWYLDPTMEKNTCYYAPRGVGDEWQTVGLGCHNPRLDLDNITCDSSVSDPNDSQFCAPENINVDFPPNDQWIRIGVHYYSSHGLNYDVHPTVKIFCNGALAGELGSAGYYMPETPVTFAPFDGSGLSNRFWVVADVAFKHDQCTDTCIVKPVYSSPGDKTPFFTNADSAVNTFAPAYPPLP